jgi:hypothetical protein
VAVVERSTVIALALLYRTVTPLAVPG